ncbi:hypothetical protein AQI95_35925 [Streptomyces yokosukanensis]|uniref:Uncharacterized protein n=1 Tax=Streptomyces yokosukanensis TaxID=67386 RepID=A0A117PZT6_9ACTN|nr:hypothetical protein [Streptomyces yokosukanensis]KUM99908.1 hypothetical protein AQI95_35925 [Streptomyces yokosukanensis]
MGVIDRETQTAFDAARDRYGRTVHHHAEAAARARRNQAALATYATHLVPHAGQLLDAARSALDALPPARHTSAWCELLDALAASHTEVTRALDRPAAPGTPAKREQHTAVWPHLAFWAENGCLAADLADQHHPSHTSELTAEERQMWTEMAQAAQRRGELDLIESWYAVDGRLVTLAYLVEDDTDTVVALTGDPGAPGWEVIGQYDNVYAAGQALPGPVPPGVLRADGSSRFNRPEPPPELPLQELLRDVIEARGAGDVSEALLSATQSGYDAGPMVRLEQLLETAAEFSHALDTVQGRQTGARLEALGRQLAFLVREVHAAADDLGATVAVLPPHRTPAPPRVRPRPAVTTAPAATLPRSTAPARRP